jgi:hypothetical protein
MNLICDNLELTGLNYEDSAKGCGNYDTQKYGVFSTGDEQFKP